jgi:hypothetical protein
MNLKKFGKVFTSKYVGPGPSSYKKRTYRAAVTQRLRNTDIQCGKSRECVCLVLPTSGRYSTHKIHVYVRLKVQLDPHGFVCIFYFTIFAEHVSGAICTHPQEHKLQSTSIGVCNLWKAEVINSIKWCGVILFICVSLWVCVY